MSRTTEEKYENDPHFHAMVTQMLIMVEKLDTSFSEIREAALFAQLKYEMKNPRTVFFSPELSREIQHRSMLVELLRGKNDQTP